MTTDWVNEIQNMDGEALFKLLERLADAAERIAENTERSEPEDAVRPAPGTIGAIERNDYPGRLAPADTRFGRAQGFHMRVQNALREFHGTLQEAVGFVRHQMEQEQEVVIAELARHEAPMWRIPERYLVQPDIRVPTPRLDDVVFQPTPTQLWVQGQIAANNPRAQVRAQVRLENVLVDPAAPEGDRTEEVLATPAIMGQWRDYAPGTPVENEVTPVTEDFIQRQLNRAAAREHDRLAEEIAGPQPGPDVIPDGEL